jgi:hypothetical protein
MTMTTFSTARDLAKDFVIQELIRNWFVKPDPIVARIPMLPASGMQWIQEVTSEPTGAARKAYGGAMTASAFTWASYKAFLSQIYKRDDFLMVEAAAPIGQGGHNPHDVKMSQIWGGIAKLFRQDLLLGQPSTTTQSVAVAALLGALAGVEAGPRMFDVEDVHFNVGGSVTAQTGYLKWTAATKSMQFKAPGDASYGTEITFGATNYWRVPIPSADGLRWVYVSGTWATLNAAGNVEDTITFTPSLQATGLGIQCHPDNRNFGNLSKKGTWSSGYTTCAPTATGDALSQTNLSWLKKRLLNASGGDPSRCVIVMSEDEILKAEVLIAAWGAGGNRSVEFMGTEFNGLSYGGIPIIDNPFIPHTDSAMNGTGANLTKVYGLVLGQDHCHCRYLQLGSELAAGVSANRQMGGVAQDGTPGGTPIPMYYREIGENGSTESHIMVGSLTYEPVAKAMDSVFILDNIT